MIYLVQHCHDKNELILSESVVELLFTSNLSQIPVVNPHNIFKNPMQDDIL
jgi:hypothetical protein